jgi:hypothetical protein
MGHKTKRGGCIIMSFTCLEVHGSHIECNRRAMFSVEPMYRRLTLPRGGLDLASTSHLSPTCPPPP